MQKVTAILPSWDKTKSGSKAGFDKGWKILDKLGAPVNKLSNKIGSEAFWPTTLDKESDKAARILKSFCKDGFYTEEDRPTSDVVVKGTQRVLKKIPQSVIKNAVGLAIFTTMRTGLWISGAGGSGILIARKEDGSWSPPSGILLHTAGLGFLVGVDIYDCVVVINNRKALESFTKIRATVGGEISAVAGPLGIGGVLENDGKWKEANRPVFTYLKSRGFYAGVQVDGTVIIERTDENERFYGERIGVADILAGKAHHPPYEIKLLMETVKSAEGSADVDQVMMRALDKESAPGDLEISSPTINIPVFGVPEPDDPDPFGVLALEKEGLQIKEAGTGSRPMSTQFEFFPSPTSPIYTTFHRLSMDTLATRSNRESFMSTMSSRTRLSIDRSTQTTIGTQTDEIITPITSPTMSTFDHASIMEEEEKESNITMGEIDYTKIDMGPYSNFSTEDSEGTTAVSDSPRENPHDHDDDLNDTSFLSDDDEEVVVFEVHAAVMAPQAPQAIKATKVTVPKRGPPPPLPPRSSARSSRSMLDQACGRSPMKEGFEEVELRGGQGEEHHLKVPSREGSERGEHRLKHVSLSEGLEKEEVHHVKTVVSKNDQSNGLEAPKGLGIELFPQLEIKVVENDIAKPEGKPVDSLHAEVDKDIFHSMPTTPMEILEAK